MLTWMNFSAPSLHFQIFVSGADETLLKLTHYGQGQNCIFVGRTEYLMQLVDGKKNDCYLSRRRLRSTYYPSNKGTQSAFVITLAKRPTVIVSWWNTTICNAIETWSQVWFWVSISPITFSDNCSGQFFQLPLVFFSLSAQYSSDSVGRVCCPDLRFEYADYPNRFLTRNKVI